MNYKKIVSAAISITVLAASLISSQVNALGGASMTLSGASSASSSFAVTVYENTGSDTVTGANVELSFSQAVSGVSYDYSVGPFTAVTPSGAHNAYGTVSGQNPVATVHFTVASPATVTATVNGNSYLKHVEGSTIESFSISRGSASFTYSAPAVTPPTGSSNHPAASTPSSSTNKASNTSSTTKTGSSTTQNATEADQPKDVASNNSQTSTDKNPTDKANDTDNAKVAGYNPTLAIVLAVLAVLVGAGAIYANRNPKKVAVITAAASAAWLALLPKKKAAAKPVAKKTPAKKANVASKATNATKSKKTSTKKSTKKA
jgi:hypothetical protein